MVSAGFFRIGRRPPCLLPDAGSVRETYSHFLVLSLPLRSMCTLSFAVGALQKIGRQYHLLIYHSRSSPISRTPADTLTHTHTTQTHRVLFSCSSYLIPACYQSAPRVLFDLVLSLLFSPVRQWKSVFVCFDRGLLSPFSLPLPFAPLHLSSSAASQAHPLLFFDTNEVLQGRDRVMLEGGD